MEIKKVVIIGSGTMGSGIAAHLCNANVPVTLLDLTTEISEKAREKIYKSRPPLLIDKTKINNIKVGNINEDFDVVKHADWIVEAVVERIDIKHTIYEKIFKSRKEGAIVSSNTSSIPIQMWTGLREQLSPTILAVATCLIVLSTLILVTAELLRRRSERIRGINR